MVLTCAAMAQDEIQWVSLEEALQRGPEERKKIMVDIHTERCRWCIIMNDKTYRHPEVVRYVNQHYIAARFNAEDNGPIQYKGKTYNMTRQGKRNCHELAIEIMRGRISYPTIVFLDEQLNVIQPLPGYRDAEQYLMVLRYYAENHHYHTPWNKYLERHAPSQVIPAGGR
jgi:thioredoxin-related protein